MALAQNYTHSLIPEANDGIGISNSLAYFLIGEVRWTSELFLSEYERSTTISIVLLIAYSLVLVLEKVRLKGKSVEGVVMKVPVETKNIGGEK